MKKFFLIAGEASGDVLGSKLIRELKKLQPQAEFLGVGGKLMQAEGLKTIFPMEELSVMGFLEILPHLPKLLGLIKFTAQKIREEKPDYVITIDSPDFNFRVIKTLQNFKETKKIHLIAPSVWAYREGRAEKISKLYDLLLAILPFEPPYFEKYGLKTVFIGHPIIEDAPDFSQKEQLNLEFRKKYNIKNDDTIICVTPGSRNSEVSKIFPEFISAVNNLDSRLRGNDKGERFGFLSFPRRRESRPSITEIKLAIPVVEKTKKLITKLAKNLKVEYFLIEKEEKKSALFASNFALAKSGTNTVELSLYKIPMIIAYKINPLTHFIVKRMVKIKFANLVNLISNREIIPEMLQDDCMGEKIAEKLQKFLVDKNLGEKQVNESREALQMLGLDSKENSSKKAALEILKL